MAQASATEDMSQRLAALFSFVVVCMPYRVTPARIGNSSGLRPWSAGCGPSAPSAASGAWSVELPDLAAWDEPALEALASDLELALKAAADGQPVEPDWEQQAALLEAARFSDP